MYAYIDPDLKIDQIQTEILLDRDKVSELGLNMQDVGNVLGNSLSEGYINYFNYAGRSYQVIPQMIRDQRLNADQVLNYYIKTVSGKSIPMSTIATLKNQIVPESLNHFQQLNSTTISAIAFPGITMGQTGKDAANRKKCYYVDYANRPAYKRRYRLIVTLFLHSYYFSLAALFESFRDPLIVLISVPMSICGAMIFISLELAAQHSTFIAKLVITLIDSLVRTEF